MKRLRLVVVAAAALAFAAPAVAQTGGSNPQIEQSSSGCGWKSPAGATS
jgi:hypothetical protein